MWPFSKKDSFDQILKTHLDDDFTVFACGKDAPRLRVVKEFEIANSLTLPNDFLEFSCSKLGGIYVEVKEAVWPKAKQFEVGPFWSFLRGLVVYGFAEGIPEFMDMRVQVKLFREQTESKNVPFMKILGDADVYCFDEAGMVLRWDHETGEFASQQKTFSRVFEAEVKELRARKDQKIAARQEKG